MVRERTGYRTLNRTRMLTGSGQPLFSNVQSLNIELLCCCSPSCAFSYCGPTAERALRRRRGDHTLNGITPTALRCSD